MNFDETLYNLIEKLEANPQKDIEIILKSIDVTPYELLSAVQQVGGHDYLNVDDSILKKIREDIAALVKKIYAFKTDDEIIIVTVDSKTNISSIKFLKDLLKYNLTEYDFVKLIAIQTGVEKNYAVDIYKKILREVELDKPTFKSMSVGELGNNKFERVDSTELFNMWKMDFAPSALAEYLGK